jgi:hypothetical protein
VILGMSSHVWLVLPDEDLSPEKSGPVRLLPERTVSVVVWGTTVVPVWLTVSPLMVMISPVCISLPDRSDQLEIAL